MGIIGQFLIILAITVLFHFAFFSISKTKNSNSYKFLSLATKKNVKMTKAKLANAKVSFQYNFIQIMLA